MMLLDKLLRDPLEKGIEMVATNSIIVIFFIVWYFLHIIDFIIESVLEETLGII
jgi:hypothetical protein